MGEGQKATGGQATAYEAGILAPSGKTFRNRKQRGLKIKKQKRRPQQSRRIVKSKAVEAGCLAVKTKKVRVDCYTGRRGGDRLDLKEWRQRSNRKNDKGKGGGAGVSQTST